MRGEPKFVSRAYDWGWLVTRVTEVIAETTAHWMVRTEGRRDPCMVKKNGRGEWKPWGREPHCR
jgi:hypothetical protein